MKNSDERSVRVSNRVKKGGGRGANTIRKKGTGGSTFVVHPPHVLFDVAKVHLYSESDNYYLQFNISFPVAVNQSLNTHGRKSIAFACYISSLFKIFRFLSERSFHESYCVIGPCIVYVIVGIF